MWNDVSQWNVITIFRNNTGRARSQNEISTWRMFSRWSPARLMCLPWIWEWYGPPKRRFTFTESYENPKSESTFQSGLQSSAVWFGPDSSSIHRYRNAFTKSPITQTAWSLSTTDRTDGGAVLLRQFVRHSWCSCSLHNALQTNPSSELVSTAPQEFPNDLRQGRVQARVWGCVITT
jgi:hypothetical protein